MMQSLPRTLTWIAKVTALAAALCMVAIPLSAPAQVSIGFTIGQAPPPLPYYEQPVLSTPGETWQPGYWAWGPAGYYWVPGTWVMPPSSGQYWTPGYWNYDNGGYGWNNGYWAPQVGYYGGINYGYGYFGNGFNGGMWNNGVFSYNTAVMQVNPNIVRHVYVNRNGVIVERTTRYGYNGPGGVIVRPTAAQLTMMRIHHFEPTYAQVEHARIAAEDRTLYYNYNHGRPTVLAVERPVTSVRVLPHYQAVTAADREVAQREIRTRTTTTHTTTVNHPATHTTTTRSTTTTHTTTHNVPPPQHTTTTHTTTTHTAPEHNTAPVHPVPPTHTGTVNATHPAPASHPATSSQGSDHNNSGNGSDNNDKNGGKPPRG